MRPLFRKRNTDSTPEASIIPYYETHFYDEDGEISDPINGDIPMNAMKVCERKLAAAHWFSNEKFQAFMKSNDSRIAEVFASFDTPSDCCDYAEAYDDDYKEIFAEAYRCASTAFCGYYGESQVLFPMSGHYDSGFKIGMSGVECFNALTSRLMKSLQPLIPFAENDLIDCSKFTRIPKTPLYQTRFKEERDSKKSRPKKTTVDRKEGGKLASGDKIFISNRDERNETRIKAIENAITNAIKKSSSNEVSDQHIRFIIGIDATIELFDPTDGPHVPRLLTQLIRLFVNQDRGKLVFFNVRESEKFDLKKLLSGYREGAGHEITNLNNPDFVPPEQKSL
ncbi:hypothetical protein F5Y16DRAFT_401932 [Xylariaceae sp. FL0255]|nr:hypothetical protein F5Y16DRAFT_401932 [Xylariaceae sp. FL0255]